MCLTWRLDRHQNGLRPAERDIVFEVIRTSEPLFAKLVAAVVMDDHVHVLARPESGTTGRRLARAWKGMSAQRLVKEQARATPVWQRDYFDRWMHSPQQTAACVSYIQRNPIRRWPQVMDYPWSLVRL